MPQSLIHDSCWLRLHADAAQASLCGKLKRILLRTFDQDVSQGAFLCKHQLAAGRQVQLSVAKIAAIGEGQLRHIARGKCPVPGDAPSIMLQAAAGRAVHIAMQRGELLAVQIYATHPSPGHLAELAEGIASEHLRKGSVNLLLAATCATGLLTLQAGLLSVLEQDEVNAAPAGGLPFK